MAERTELEPQKLERTRTSSTWIAISVAVVFLVLLIIFIAQNNRKVPLKFLGTSGTVSESLALVGSAVAGAILVLAVGAARIIQLRLGTRRQNRAIKKSKKQDAADTKAARNAPPTSALPPTAPAAVGEAQPVEPEH